MDPFVRLIPLVSRELNVAGIVSAVQLRIATWNVWGEGEPWRYTVERGVVRGAVPGSIATTERTVGGSWVRRRPIILQALRAADAHLVGLQEIVRDPVDGTFQSDQLASALRCNVVGPTDSGLALLSRYPILSSAELPIHHLNDGYGAHDALHVVVSTPSGRLDVLVAHLTPRSPRTRVQQLTTITRYLRDLPKGPVVLVGDLNTVDTDKPELDVLHRDGLRDAWGTVGIGPGATMPGHEPISRLDYIWLGPGLNPQRAELIGTDPDHDGYYASDHLGVLVESQSD